jgi:adenylate kinase family enzyme
VHQKGEEAVLICGSARAGKTTCAQYLEEEYGFKRYALADKLKQLHNNATGETRKDREWLQKMGTACRNTFGESFWIDRMVEQIDLDGKSKIVIDDVRYDNELMELYERLSARYETVTCYLVTASLETRVRRGVEIHLMNHISEHLAQKLSNMVEVDEDTRYVIYKDIMLDALDGGLDLSDYFIEIDYVRSERL